MNKSSLGYFLLLIALFTGAFNYSSSVQEPFISSLNFIKKGYHNITTYIANRFDKHFSQAQTIAQLKTQLQEYKKEKLIIHQLASEYHALEQANDINMSLDPKVKLSRVISYQKFGNHNRLWIDIQDYNSSKIYGLTYKNIVAGIVIEKDGQALALLNNDIKSTYAVLVGDQKAPGIARGNNDANIIVNFIPAWYDIHVGSEVVSSGLDNIFFKGLKVGKVISIDRSEGYQNAVVEPYYVANDPNYFYVIEETK